MLRSSTKFPDRGQRVRLRRLLGGSLLDTVTSMPLNPTQLAQLVDHTLLRTDATAADVRALVDEASDLSVFAVCISPSMLHFARDLPSEVMLGTVCGFPSGKHATEIKAAEAAAAIRQGAREVDMVIDVGQLRAGDVDGVTADVAGVRAAMPGSALLKVIIESAALSDEEIVKACRAAELGGAQFVKTSTGFHAKGGARVEAVRLMSDTVGGRLGVKASGGIRTWDDAVAMVEAGATRLGLSGTAAVLSGGPVVGTDAY